MKLPFSCRASVRSFCNIPVGHRDNGWRMFLGRMQMRSRRT
jgi:hypothetical protein